ncbi:MAG: porin family protein [Bacteroidales bacterium]|nr:porin family protein [Bacteroidales bacterium]
MQINNSIYYRLLLLLVIAFPSVIYSQSDTYPKQIGIGLKGGTTYNNLVVSFPIQQINSNIIPSYGLIFTYIDKKTVGLQLEINYITKSWEEKTIDNYLYNAEINYLEIPMFTTLHFGNRFKFIINFGPYLSILLDQVGNLESIQDSEYFPYYENRVPRKGDFGLSGGAGLRLKTKVGLFQLEMRYSQSFQNLYDPTISNLDYSVMQTLGVYLSYQFLFSNDR